VTDTAPAPAPTATTPGATDLINSDHAAMFAARAEIDSLKADKDFAKLLLSKVDQGAIAPPEVLAAKQRWAELHKKGYPPVVEIRSPSDALQQQEQRNTAAMDEYIQHVKTKIPLTEQQEREIRSGRISKADRQWAVEEKERCMREANFLARYRASDRDVVERWNYLLQMLSLRPV
jgi:hypothetical protein